MGSSLFKHETVLLVPVPRLHMHTSVHCLNVPVPQRQGKMTFLGCTSVLTAQGRELARGLSQSSIPGSHMLEGKNQLLKVVL